MNDENFYEIRKMIRETFNDPRPIKCVTPESECIVDEHIHKGGIIFTTVNGEYIDFEFQLVDFTEDELVKYVELAENLFEKTGKKVSIYLLCSKEVNVCVREMDIKSKADFNIKLACFNDDPCQAILSRIKNKLRQGLVLTDADMEALSMLHVMCDKKDEHYYLREYIRIRNRMHY